MLALQTPHLRKSIPTRKIRQCGGSGGENENEGGSEGEKEIGDAIDLNIHGVRWKSTKWVFLFDGEWGLSEGGNVDLFCFGYGKTHRPIALVLNQRQNPFTGRNSRVRRDPRAQTRQIPPIRRRRRHRCIPCVLRLNHVTSSYFSRRSPLGVRTIARTPRNSPLSLCGYGVGSLDSRIWFRSHLRCGHRGGPQCPGSGSTVLGSPENVTLQPARCLVDLPNSLEIRCPSSGGCCTG
ncbi:OB-fold nucleic acid binding domain-containing family protein [Striga asiatica]|uniref:OB-fold nucleic acid binding domain-containing family protein n=1 Tax=Striga asiatica TaxID=4170 RepID=A0A5A7RB36_STRAF|nr:OB-fold nucleic acid binding domain-containing family protein [Striga asiatica]